MMKVAISTLTHPNKAYCFHHFFEWAESQDYSPCEYIIRVHSGEYGDHSAVKNMRESVRSQVLDQDFDALFFLDVDTIPPPDAIRQLSEVDGDIVTGIYFSRLEESRLRAVCWKHEDSGQNFLDRERISDISGAGMGCCLIHRRVLEVVNFRHEINDDDYPYWEEARRQGFRARSLNTLRCRHYYSEEGFTYSEFGAVEDASLDVYEIAAPDGITVNGQHFSGKVHTTPELIKTIKELDLPYQQGKLKTNRKVVSHVSRKNSGGTIVNPHRSVSDRAAPGGRVDHYPPVPKR